MRTIYQSLPFFSTTKGHRKADLAGVANMPNRRIMRNMRKVFNKKPPHDSSPGGIDRFNKIILDNIPVSVITIDKNGDITSTNKYFKNFSRGGTNKNKNVFTGEFFIRENLVESYRKLLSKGTAFRNDQCHQVNSKGEDKYLRIIAAPFRDEKGRVEGAISLASDNTEAVKFRNQLLKLNDSLEERVKKRTEELNAANKELSKVLESKSLFMSDLSHEFRTSLAIMQSSLEIIGRSGKPAKESPGLFDNITTEIKRASNMLADLSLLAKSSSSELKLKFEKINLNTVTASICKKLTVIARKNNVKIKFEKKSPEVIVTASKENIEKMLLNLIRNAIKYNKENGWIKVRTEATAAGVYVKVEDGGIGISEKDLPNIFDRFYRANREIMGYGEDSGLGLAICKHVAEAHGGNISVTSKLGEGTTFTVFLPRKFKKIKSHPS
jgi:signal transduction histidine kinase